MEKPRMLFEVLAAAYTLQNAYAWYTVSKLHILALYSRTVEYFTSRIRCTAISNGTAAAVLLLLPLRLRRTGESKRVALLLTQSTLRRR